MTEETIIDQNNLFIQTAKELECNEDTQAWEKTLSKLTDKEKADSK